jgi:hypothetical protein
MAAHGFFIDRSGIVLQATAACMLTCARINKGGTAVEIALRRLDVLAVCAVFAFVGAVLFGAF